MGALRVSREGEVIKTHLSSLRQAALHRLILADDHVAVYLDDFAYPAVTIGPFETHSPGFLQGVIAGGQPESDQVALQLHDFNLILI